jgi:hypothetical protein
MMAKIPDPITYMPQTINVRLANATLEPATHTRGNDNFRKERSWSSLETAVEHYISMVQPRFAPVVQCTHIDEPCQLNHDCPDMRSYPVPLCASLSSGSSRFVPTEVSDSDRRMMGSITSISFRIRDNCFRQNSFRSGNRCASDE